jgi:TonB family protein
VRCNECLASGLVEPCFCECCGRPLPSTDTDAIEAADVAEIGPASSPSARTTASSPQAGVCESCDAPTMRGQELCAACMAMFASVLHESPVAIELEAAPASLALRDEVDRLLTPHAAIAPIDAPRHEWMWSAPFAEPVEAVSPAPSENAASEESAWPAESSDIVAVTPSDDAFAFSSQPEPERAEPIAPEVSPDVESDAEPVVESAEAFLVESIDEPGEIVADAVAMAAPHHAFSADSTFHEDEAFPVVRQAWERKRDTADGTVPDASESEEPLPWWERQATASPGAPQNHVAQANAPKASAAQTHAASSEAPLAGAFQASPRGPAAGPSSLAPSHVVSHTMSPAAPNATTPRARAEDVRHAAPPRAVPRPPVPGATTRPVRAPGRRRPMYVLGGSLVVLMAIGVPAAKRWLRATPTVTLSDPDFAPASASSSAATSTDARTGARASASAEASRRSAAPSPGPSATATRTAPQASPRQTAPTRPERAPSPPAPRDSAASTSTSAAIAPAPAPVEEAVPVAPPPLPVVAPIAAISTGPVFEMGQVDDKPRVTGQVEPSVPEDLRDRPLTDLVILRVLVSQSGRPSDVNLLRRSRSGAALDNAVVAAVRQWSFTPARKRGQAVNCWYNVGVPLRLEGRTSP